MSQQQQFGKSLVRAKKKRQLQNKANFQAILDQENRQHQAQETAPKLQSVWQTTNLDDVLEAAAERQDGFTALRDVRVVVSGKTHVTTGDKLMPQTSDSHDWYALSDRLPIPERPSWNFRMSSLEVQRQEKDAFTEWRRELARLEEADEVMMTPFEKNVEVWRQLWRVVEKSDVVLEIVDARNPLAFRSAGLERFVSKHTTRAGRPKACVLLLNKADLLTENQRRAWAEYLTSKGLKFFFFSARAATEEQDARVQAGKVADTELTELERRMLEARIERGLLDDGEDDDSDSESDNGGAGPQPAGRVAQPKGPAGGAAHLDTERLEREALQKAKAEATAAAQQPKKERRRKDRRLRNAPVAVTNPYATKTAKQLAEERLKEKEAERAKPRPLTEEEVERTRRIQQSFRETIGPHDIVGPETLVDVLATLREELGVPADEPLMAGMCGYPNVGKSSTINAVLRTKRVVVSSTPGKTKHFQTLPIPNERRVMLCDCPGLVFPSFASTKEGMVCDGVLPVDTCRDYLAAVGHVCERVPRGVLEAHFMVAIGTELDQDLSASPQELFLNLLSRRKGYMTEHDKPNRYRSAHHVLKDYVDGKVVFAHPPPGLVLADPNPPKEKKPKKKPTPAAAGPSTQAAAAVAKDDDLGDEDEGWETASGDEDEDEEWEDMSDAEGARNLSDDGAADSVVSDDEEEPLTFYSFTHPKKPRAMTTAELFNFERNSDVIQRAIEAQDEDKPKRRRKANPMLVPDESYRVNRHGEKELLLDEDDEIEICGQAEPKEKKPSKRTQRRQQKRGLVAARGARPAALPGTYEPSTGFHIDPNA